MTHIELHNEALKKTKAHQSSEKDLIEILEEIRNKEVYRTLGYATFWNYLTLALKLSESEAGRFSSVIRVVSQVPKIKEAIQAGELSISKVGRLASVVTLENASTWVEKAKHSTFRELEREVKKANPEPCKQEKITPKSEELSRLSIPLSRSAEENLKRVKEILSKKRQRIVTYEECLIEISTQYLEKHDPLRKQINLATKKEREETKASRQQSNSSARQGKVNNPFPNTSPKRTPLSTMELSTVVQRDKAQCVALHPGGTRCQEKVFTHIHHKIPVNQGGGNHAENLEVLCYWHHKMAHDRILLNQS